MRPGVAAVRPDRWFRAQGFRETNWPALPTKEVLDAVTGDVPAAVISKDFHAIWLNSAGIARTGGDLRKYDVPGGVVELGADGEPTGLIREESAWRFKEDHLEYSDAEYLDALREGLEGRLVARGDGDPRQGRLDPGDSAALAGARARRGAAPPRLAVDPGTSTLDRRRGEIGIAPASGASALRVGYLKVFMDGTLGSQTALMTDGTGVEITTREELADIVRRAARGALAGRGARDRRPREPERARRVRGDEGRWQPLGLRHRIEHTQCLPPEDVRALRRARADGVGAVLATRPPTRSSRTASGPTGSTASTRSARCSTCGTRLINGSDAPIEELDAVGRDRRRRPPPLARGPARDGRGGAGRDDASRRPGRPTTSAGAASCSPATSPIWSCSTATRSRSRPRSYPRCRWWRRWSAAAGRITRRPGDALRRQPVGRGRERQIFEPQDEDLGHELDAGRGPTSARRSRSSCRSARPSSTPTSRWPPTRSWPSGSRSRRRSRSACPCCRRCRSGSRRASRRSRGR